MISKLTILALLISSTVAIITPNLIGNATKASYADAPWIVSLQMFEDDYAYCGATLIHVTGYGDYDNTSSTLNCSGFVVTAASCLEGVPNIIAILGNINLSEEEKEEIKLTVSNYSWHNSTNTKYENDIGLIHVQFNVSKSDDETCSERFVVLPLEPDHQINETFFVQMNASISGWGLLADNGPLQKELYNTTLPLYSDKDCADAIGHEDYKPKSMLCAGGGSDGPNSYDTGGPLTCQYKMENDETYKYLCGVASYGPMGGSRRLPAIFADVANFAPWINAIIGNYTAI